MGALRRLKDVDSVVLAFSSLSAYRPTTTFDVYTVGKTSVCMNKKLLQAVFGDRSNSFNHVEFTLGGDPSLPLRVLISVPKQRTSDSGSESSGSCTSVEEASDVINLDYRLRYMECVFEPAVLKLPPKSLSKMKGAGNVTSRKWHIHPSDWSKLSLEADRISSDMNFSGKHLFYVASHGMQMPPDQLLSYIGRFADQHHKPVVIFQVHHAVTLALKSMGSLRPVKMRC